MKKLFFLLMLFVFGCSKVELPIPESIGSQADATLYLINIVGCPDPKVSGCDGWVGISIPGSNRGSVYGREVISGSLPAGKEITISASPAEGYYFDKWSNGWTANPITFSINSDIDITAIFKKD